MNTIYSEMREWLLECFEDEYDQEQIQSLSDSQLEKSIDRYFDGGKQAFYDMVLA